MAGGEDQPQQVVVDVIGEGLVEVLAAEVPDVVVGLDVRGPRSGLQQIVLHLHPQVPVFKLPASRRLVADTVAVVQPAFYPTLPFTSAALAGDRRVRFNALGLRNPIDSALDMIAAGKSIVALVVPGSPPSASECDPDVERLAAATVQRLLQRQPEWIGQRALDQTDIGVADAHDPAQSILGQARYDALLYRHLGSWNAVFAAYNEGEGGYRAHGAAGVETYRDGSTYLDRLAAALESLTGGRWLAPGVGAPGQLSHGAARRRAVGSTRPARPQSA